MTPETMARRLARAERRVELLEAMIDERVHEQAVLDRDLASAAADLESAQELMPTALVIVDMLGRIVRVNRIARAIAQRPAGELDDQVIDVLWPGFVAPASGEVEQREVAWQTRGGVEVPMLVSLRCTGFRTVCIGIDLRDRYRDEEVRRRAQKLEALGQLAAGIAHELNTPMQFISDNVHLLQRGCGGMRMLLERLREVHTAALAGDVPPALFDRVREAERDTRWSYDAAKLERAFARAQDGVDRVTRIVSAMKVFSHPANNLAAIDINRALETTIVVATPELKHVARVELDLGVLPPLMGYRDDLNQMFLNLLVNAAHAIADAKRDERGTITLRTRATPTHALIEIADTGCGIPDAIRERVYDPFFTTKVQGRGTGQGLALAHAVVVGRHRGSIDFETSAAGTTFHIALPFRPQEQQP